MINYIKQIDKQLIIFYENNTPKIYKESIETYIDNILLNDLTTYKGRLDAVKKKYNYKKLIPIYINQYICLIPLYSLKSEYNLYINIYNILDINGSTIIAFKNGMKIKINKQIKTIKDYVKRARKIDKSLCLHFY